MRFVSGGAGAGAIVIGLALTLAGCVGDPAPIVTRTPSGGPVVAESPEVTPSPTPTGLSNDELFAMMPEGADREDLYGAMVTAQFFLEQYSVMFQTGDTRVWEALSDPGCAPCGDGIGGAHEVAVSGSTVRGGAISVDPSQSRGTLESPILAVVVLGASVADGYVVDADGVETKSVDAGDVLYAFELARDAGVWRVVELASEVQ